MIFFTNQNTHFKFNKKRQTRLAISKLLDMENFQTGEVSVVFCTDEFLQEINSKYLNHDTLTDVITFNYNEGRRISGEAFISVERVAENAAEYKTSFDEELDRVIYHAILHLCGYDDKTPEDEQIMRTKEDYYLKYLNQND
ncbi:MAG: rRNA maturation RNase YbeY [Prevotellaceae bacterium]|jgi:rRNA maturation RNase YbeY|nr:rRNA maturation RNase YbeY [Prevotellaceae bacterium]